MQNTLSIIKPDAVKKNVVGQILSRFEKANLELKAFRKIQLSQKQAEDFYIEHKERPFYKDLVDFMMSGPVVVTVLSGENAICKNRELMGDTNPKNAKAGTIRADFATSIDANAVHGSDSEESAKREINFFFSGDSLV
jgi:nucleoside-diphosphate kinase